MAEFICKLGAPSGRVTQETHQATSENELRARLGAEGYYVFSVRPKDFLRVRVGTRQRSGPIGPDDLLIFNQQFMTLAKSGLPLQKSLDLLARQARNEDLRAILEGVRDKVRGGELLSDAFESTGRFPKIYCATLRAGERSGSLDKVLSQYVTYQKVARGFRKKFLSALIYPAFLMVFLIALILLVDFFIIPKFTQFYSELNVPLPALTVLLISLGHAMRKWALAALVGIILAVFALRSARRSGAFRLAWERLKFRLPVAGKLFLKFAVAEFARTLATLLQAGTSVVAALQTASEASSSPLLAQGVAKARKEVTAGKPLSASLRDTGLFPEMALDMVEVGETTGALPAMLDAVADFFEEDVGIDLAAMVALVDPLMIAVIAVAVGFVLVGFYLPLFSLAGQVH
jgi:type IV pilus assembly protein PilC